MDLTPFYGTIWALFPPIAAIILALLTKEVYSSLFIGILSGALLQANWSIWGCVTGTFDTMISKICDGWQQRRYNDYCKN